MKLSPLALAVALTPIAAHAQPMEPYQAQPLIISRGTPLQTPAPASVAVIDRQQIEASCAPRPACNSMTPLAMATGWP